MTNPIEVALQFERLINAGKGREGRKGKKSEFFGVRCGLIVFG